jgi:hypothetical protein
MEISMRVAMSVLGVGLFLAAWTHVPAAAVFDGTPAVLRDSIEISAAAKRKKPRAASQQPAYGPRPHFGGVADPSFGPDGKPYKVPEYLRNQCYIDEGYGRFSACSNRL